MTNPPQDQSAPGPLAGVKVLDLSTVVLGPFATLIFGDLGAEVIKVENARSGPAGDIMRYAGHSPTGDLGPIFTALNRNKTSVDLDLSKPENRAVLEAHIRDSDVLFHNVRMAGMERLGLGYADVKAINPRIIYVHCAGFGAGGAYEHRQAYDDLIQAASGFADLFRLRDGSDPQYAPSLVADKTVGLFATYATLAALYHRERTGEAQFVQVPMMECFTFFNMVENLYGETFLPGNGRLAYTRSVNKHRRPYPTKDGFISIVPYADSQWETFFRLGGRPDVFADPRFSTYKARTEHIGELYAIIGEVSSSKTSQEWLDLLGAEQIPAMRYNTMADVLEDEHLTSVDFFQEREHPEAGPYRTMRHPVFFSATPASVRKDPPRFGADTDAFKAEVQQDTE